MLVTVADDATQTKQRTKKQDMSKINNPQVGETFSECLVRAVAMAKMEPYEVLIKEFPSEILWALNDALTADALANPIPHDDSGREYWEAQGLVFRTV